MQRGSRNTGELPGRATCTACNSIETFKTLAAERGVDLPRPPQLTDHPALATAQEAVDEHTGIVGSTTGNNYYVRILST